jgi:F-type H+-transporting ATPase subunit delta
MISSTAKIYANALSKLSVNHSIMINELDFIWSIISKINGSGVLTYKNAPIKYKRKIIGTLLKNANISLTIKKIVQILLDNNKLDIIPKIKSLYEKNILIKENIKEALLTLSRENSNEEIENIFKAMKQKFGYNFKFVIKIDKNIIDGFIIKFDDFVLDLSLKGKLDKITQKIKNL